MPALCTKPEGKRVLIVDQCADNRNSLGMLLRTLGHSATVASDAAGALEAARAGAPDLIIAELRLTGTDGMALAAQLHDEGLLDATLLAAHSGYCRAVDRGRAAEAGFDRFLAKPATLEDFCGLLELCVSKSFLPRPARA